MEDVLELAVEMTTTSHDDDAPESSSGVDSQIVL